jgi:uncharacterized protein YkwD
VRPSPGEGPKARRSIGDKKIMRLFVAIAAAGMVLLGFSVVPNTDATSFEQLIAPPGACAGAGDANAPTTVQESAMLCMTNFARGHDGLGELGDSAKLDRAAGLKSADIIRCDSFSHEACGREFTFWMQRVGYFQTRCWRAAENIAWGTGSNGTARSIFSAWIFSDVHRENILGSFGQVGIAVRVGALDGHGGAHVWTQQFGQRC